jgi:ABC-type polysaccharide/polyol phosphate export permease
MPAVAPVPTADPATGSELSTRPALLLAMVLDGGLGILTYLAAYWLRFHDTQLREFLPGAWMTLPFVVAGQLGTLAFLGAYARRGRVDWLLRVIGGIVLGTAVATAVVWVSLGFDGVSRSAFVADALLFSVAAVVWRGIFVLRARARMRAALQLRPGVLVDRAAETSSIRAVVASLLAYRELLKRLVLKDLKLKYRGSVFGFLWSLINPLLMIVVYTIAFTFILRIRTAGFVFYLMLGQLSWALFASSAAMSTGAIVDNSGLLKSVLFPRAILPIATVLFNLAQYLLTLAVFLPVMLIWFQVPLAAPMLLFPVFLLLQVVFTVGVAFILSTATAFFRDTRHLLEVALAVLFWTTPIVYELHQVPERIQLLILLSPVSPFVVAYQQMFFYRAWPDPSVWLAAAVHASGAFVVGALLFLAFEDRFTEQL